MAIAAKSYVLNREGKAVEHDGKTSGVLLVSEGGTLSDELVRQHGISVRKQADIDAERDAEEAARQDALKSRRPVFSTAPAGNPSGQVADAAAVEAAKQTSAAMNGGPSPLAPVTVNAPASTADGK